MPEDRAIEARRSYFTDTVFPTPVSDMATHHELVFQTVVSLKTQQCVIERSWDLEKYIVQHHEDPNTGEWVDRELESLIGDMMYKCQECMLQVRGMLEALGERFTIDIRLQSDDEIEEGEIAESNPRETRLILGSIDLDEFYETGVIRLGYPAE
ncbi:hypothetical protein ABW19_dt0206977 [Dactylella cylindrospora]|nr:hypothetical protein ABW19_dt0206977 [Dactylella cylindrospora]